MTHIEWKEVYAIGIYAIDQQHKRVMEIISELYQAHKSGVYHTVITDVLNDLFECTVNYFGIEEQMHIDYEYPKASRHKQEHEQFIVRLNELRKIEQKDNLLLSLKTLDMLKDWTISHMLGSDKEFAEYLEQLEAVKFIEQLNAVKSGMLFPNSFYPSKRIMSLIRLK